MAPYYDKVLKLEYMDESWTITGIYRVRLFSPEGGNSTVGLATVLKRPWHAGGLVEVAGRHIAERLVAEQRLDAPQTTWILHRGTYQTEDGTVVPETFSRLLLRWQRRGGAWVIEGAREFTDTEGIPTGRAWVENLIGESLPLPRPGSVYPKPGQRPYRTLLQQARAERELSQAELATAANATRNTIGLMEQGATTAQGEVRGFRAATALRVARVLGMDLGDLFQSNPPAID